MFLEILKTLIKVLIVFFILVVAFGLAFYILLSRVRIASFPLSRRLIYVRLVEYLAIYPRNLRIDACFQGNHLAFSNVPISVMRTFAMMLGEIDFLGTYVYPYYNVEDDIKTIPSPFPVFCILGLFMILMPILLMNLLVGLAIGDIESVKQNAKLKRLAMQVRTEMVKIFGGYANSLSRQGGAIRIGCKD